MKTFSEYFTEQKVSTGDLNSLEKTLDKLYSILNIDVEFTRHFIDRSIKELQALFTKTFNKYGAKLRDSDIDWQGVITDLNTSINVPFALEWNKKRRELELIAKTTMRKKNFKTSNEKLPV